MLDYSTLKSSILMYQVNGGPNRQGGWKKIRNLINGGLESEKRLSMIIQGQKEQKQVVVKLKLKYIQQDAILP